MGEGMALTRRMRVGGGLSLTRRKPNLICTLYNEVCNFGHQDSPILTKTLI